MSKGPEYWHSRRLSMTLWSFLLISSVVVEVQSGRTRLGPGHFDSGEKKKKNTSPMRPASDSAVLQDRLERRPGHTHGQNQGQTQGQRAHIHLHFLETCCCCFFFSFFLCFFLLPSLQPTVPAGTRTVRLYTPKKEEEDEEEWRGGWGGAHQSRAGRILCCGRSTSTIV